MCVGGGVSAASRRRLSGRLLVLVLVYRIPSSLFSPPPPFVFLTTSRRVQCRNGGDRPVGHRDGELGCGREFEWVQQGGRERGRPRIIIKPDGAHALSFPIATRAAHARAHAHAHTSLPHPYLGLQGRRSHGQAGPGQATRGAATGGEEGQRRRRRRPGPAGPPHGGQGHVRNGAAFVVCVLRGVCGGFSGRLLRVGFGRVCGCARPAESREEGERENDREARPPWI